MEADRSGDFERSVRWKNRSGDFEQSVRWKNRRGYFSSFLLHTRKTVHVADRSMCTLL